MGIASWVLIGLLTGSIARVAMPGPAAGGMSVAILIGVIGAINWRHSGDDLLAGCVSSLRSLRVVSSQPSAR